MSASELSSKVKHFDANGFDHDVLGSDKPVLVDFYADWCGPCRMLAPTVEDLAEQYDGRAVIGKLDVDTAPQVAAQYGISSIPAVFLFRDGEVVERFVGVQPGERLSAAIEKQLTQ